MKKYKREFRLSIILISTSMIIYYLQIVIFGEKPSIIYESFLSQLAFLPIYILLVTIIFEQLLDKKQKEAKIRKINILVGAFYSEIGKELLHKISLIDKNLDNVREKFIFTEESFEDNFSDTLKFIKTYSSNITSEVDDLNKLKIFLVDKKESLFSITKNSELMEHENFTELVLAVFHLYDELSRRDELNDISKTDYEHLQLDIERVYLRLLNEWVKYLKHLSKEYPYLFSLEIRVNALCLNASVEVK